MEGWPKGGGEEGEEEMELGEVMVMVMGRAVSGAGAEAHNEAFCQGLQQLNPLLFLLLLLLLFLLLLLLLLPCCSSSSSLMCMPSTN